MFLSIGLFLAMLVVLELGRRFGMRRLKQDPEGARAGAGTVEGAVFALLGLLIAFTFSGAAGRFDTRRQLIVEETNQIGTAYLRLDLLRAEAQPALREKFRQYLDSRIETYRKLPDMAAAKRELGKTVALQGEIWRLAVAASKAEGAAPGAPVLLLPALNGMFDIVTTRTLATEIHPPTIIFVMLISLALASALMVGYAMAGSKGHNWLHVVALPLVIAASIYVILDIEYPRFGFIRVDAFDHALLELRRGMN